MSKEKLTCGDYAYVLQEDGTAKITGVRREAKVRKPEKVCVPDQLDGDSVVGLGGEAFREMKTMREVRLPDSLEVIGQYAFYKCIGLERLILPPSVREIGRYAFLGCEQAIFEASPGSYVEAWLAARLLETGDKQLIEGNTWGDTFWGADIRTGRGENHLGKALMKVRQELRDSFAEKL